MAKGMEPDFRQARPLHCSMPHNRETIRRNGGAVWIAEHQSIAIRFPHAEFQANLKLSFTMMLIEHIYRKSRKGPKY
jgi:hypothetical protein